MPTTAAISLTVRRVASLLRMISSAAASNRSRTASTSAFGRAIDYSQRRTAGNSGNRHQRPASPRVPRRNIPEMGGGETGSVPRARTKIDHRRTPNNTISIERCMGLRLMEQAASNQIARFGKVMISDSDRRNWNRATISPAMPSASSPAPNGVPCWTEGGGGRMQPMRTSIATSRTSKDGRQKSVHGGSKMIFLRLYHFMRLIHPSISIDSGVTKRASRHRRPSRPLSGA